MRKVDRQTQHARQRDGPPEPRPEKNVAFGPGQGEAHPAEDRCATVGDDGPSDDGGGNAPDHGPCLVTEARDTNLQVNQQEQTGIGGEGEELSEVD